MAIRREIPRRGTVPIAACAPAHAWIGATASGRCCWPAARHRARALLVPAAGRAGGPRRPAEARGGPRWDLPAANMKTARPPPAGGSLIIATWTGKYPPGGFV